MREHRDEGHTESCLSCSTESSVSRDPFQKREIFIALTSMAILIVGLVIEFILELRLIAQILFIIVIVLSGYRIVKEGLSSAIIRRRLDMNFLMIVAAVGAFAIGHGEEGAAVIFLFSVAELLEEYAGKRARRSIEVLMKLAPEVATVMRDGKRVTVHVHSVDVNELVLVKPGEKIPLDGIVVKGVSSVNQAPITGESIPILKQVGDVVYAGTINNEGFLEVRTTKKSTETLISKIVRLVEEAQKRRSPTEKFIDRFSKYYTPTVIILALFVATVPPFIFEMSFNEWLYKALVLLVVSCPCALAISTPVTMVSGITSGARNGVLIKGSTYVEEIGKTRVFAFDKTGTLTEGKPEVTDVISLTNPDRGALMIAASLESHSNHPIAKAVVERAEDEGLKLIPVRDFKSIPGKGVRGAIDGRVYYVGSRRLFIESSIRFPEEKIRELENEGKTVILVGDGSEAIGLIAVMDRVREATVRSIAELRRRGIRTEMITGDNERTARAIAEKIGVDEFHAELLPEDKVNIIKNELASKYGHVAMVGDGVNDAPALAAASVGIAMGAIGSDVSLETADIALMQDDLSKLPYLIELSKRTITIVKENVLASLLIKGSLAILAFPGLVSLWIAVAVGDMGLSLAVILNAMRLSMLKSRDTALDHRKVKEDVASSSV